ncbi:MAG TPA: hypothetical protein VGD42_08545 [Lysobacter sp.]
MKNNVQAKSDMPSGSAGDVPPTEPVYEFDHEKSELNISVPYVPKYVFVTLWGTLNGQPTQPPAPLPPMDEEGVPVKPPKEIKVVIMESDSGVWPDPDPKT